MTGNTVILTISMPKKLAQDVDRLAREESMTRSEFVRDLLRRQIAWRNLEPVRKDFARQARKAGIRTWEDAVRVVDEVRHGR